MRAEVVGENADRVEQNTDRAEDEVSEVRKRGVWPKIRAKVGDSAWGSLAGKGILYIGGFALLAAVGSGRIHCLAAPAHEKEAPPIATAAMPMAALAAAPPPSGQDPALASSVACRSDAGAESDAGGDGGEAKDAADGGAAQGGLRPDGKVAINAATEEDLRHLPGIGATRAKAILALRAKLGRFTRVEDLLRVKGIGRRSLARLRPMIVID